MLFEHRGRAAARESVLKEHPHAAVRAPRTPFSRRFHFGSQLGPWAAFM